MDRKRIERELKQLSDPPKIEFDGILTKLPLSAGDNSWRGSTSKLVADWEKIFPNHYPQQIYDQFTKGLGEGRRCSVRIMGPADPKIHSLIDQESRRTKQIYPFKKATHISVSVFGRDYQDVVGSYGFSKTLDNQQIEFEVLHTYPAYQRKGYASIAAKNAVEFFTAIGIPKVAMEFSVDPMHAHNRFGHHTSMGENGLYTMARMGALVEDFEWGNVRSRIGQKWGRLRKYFEPYQESSEVRGTIERVDALCANTDPHVLWDLSDLQIPVPGDHKRRKLCEALLTGLQAYGYMEIAPGSRGRERLDAYCARQAARSREIG